MPDGVVVTVWTSAISSINANTTPLIIYAKVTKGIRPVWNASVIATVSRPGMSSMDINLKDTGLGGMLLCFLFCVFMLIEEISNQLMVIL